MAVRKDTLFEQFLAPVFKFLINQPELERFYRRIDWEQERDRLRDPNLVYPDYYQSQNFHGIEGGYLTTGAAVSYDPVTQYALPPNETWVRQGLVDAIQGNPRRILDLGCGTGSTTILLKMAFPQAEVIGLDLSPYMLIVAETKARQAGLQIEFRHGQAEQTGFADSSFDLVSASLLFHETPSEIAQAVLQEGFRLLRTGGEILILDGNQKTLRHTEWLTNIFEEPYIQEYAAGSLDGWMGRAGFGAIRTDEWWWLHQISRGVKPILDTQPDAPPGTGVQLNPVDWSHGLPELA
ncbi:MAG: methyltransferase domain-containing protein [Oscillatoriales cyanobacterium RM1_1_9]|nr:methyltransferase domain-containing protein [Oscillatoriales cyanobacterium SM2_3_0]NJO44192.1 methyltransferase domain-containing protein [Oscillatoriales cyanobacterium RM2_1_1]NJO72144.1 methyltransferase domain-containing protein [Oscillatoriales cyanobacterium RM1_1_9]